MSFLKLLHGMKKRKDLFDIACDYDGYDIVYEEETTDVNLYKFFNEIITNLRYDITVLPEYRLLMENNTEDAFNEFYDAWVDALIGGSCFIWMVRCPWSSLRRGLIVYYPILDVRNS